MNPAEKHPHIPARGILDRIALGGSDGAIEGLAITSALNGAKIGFGAITVAGLAFAVAGAISIFFSAYLARRSELNSLKIDMARERMEIQTEPEEEKSEMQGLLKKDGYDDREVDIIMRRLTRDKDLYLKEMLRRELGVNPDDTRSDMFRGPIAAGISFLALGLLAVSPYLLATSRSSALLASVVLSLAALFALGSRVFVPKNFRPIAGMEFVLVGAVAGGLLYYVGVLLSGA